MLVPVVEQESRRGVFTWLQFISSTPCASDTETQSKYEYKHEQENTGDEMGSEGEQSATKD